MTKNHLWEDTFIDDGELATKLKSLKAWVADDTRESLKISELLVAAEKYRDQLVPGHPSYASLYECLLNEKKISAKEVTQMLAELATFLKRDELELKLKSELGSSEPFTLTRQQYTDSIFEAWAPLGVLAHVAPSNAPGVAPLSVIEGLLAGNISLLKTGRGEGLFPQLFLKGLIDCDDSGKLKKFIVAARISSKDQKLLSQFLEVADGVAVWGGEDAVNAIKSLSPKTARIIEWGHKISFIYLAADFLKNAQILEQAAKECCLFEQQACSSPQCLFVETDEWDVLEEFGTRFAEILGKVSKTFSLAENSDEEAAEITLVTELAREESCFGQAKVIEDPEKKWRVLIDARPALVASPLYRTIWVKPLPRKRIVETLQPMRQYLQTAGLGCALADVPAISTHLFKAGVIRVRRIGDMAGSYNGEPHDGVYALQRYSRRVSLQMPDKATGFLSFSDLKLEEAPRWRELPKIMGKEDFQNLKIDESDARLFFKSGGSSGEPKMSVFRYEDYHSQMRAGAEGLYAAGFEPLSDRSMNLFFSGALYGGFLSIFSVLEELKAVQFPMAAQLDDLMVTESIIKNRVDVLLGMPSYLIQLFEKNKKALKDYGGVKKVFFGGEHFNDAQRRFLTVEFGIKLIKSVGYGSVDAGPLGYQCAFCVGSEHHLHQKLQYLEILKLDRDEPVEKEESGRLVFTSKMRKGLKLERYDLGDCGQWVVGVCPCGRASPKFRLLGRSGDVVRVGSVFLNYEKFRQLFNLLDYVGPLQLELDHEGLAEKITVRFLDSAKDQQNLSRFVLNGYDDLREVVEIEKILKIEFISAKSEDFILSQGSGKILNIVDKRKR